MVKAKRVRPETDSEVEVKVERPGRWEIRGPFTFQRRSRRGAKTVESNIGAILRPFSTLTLFASRVG